jgi:NADH:ubiquinone oxidoreductase subunit 3 (subunit A)
MFLKEMIEYASILVFLVFSIILSLVLPAASYILGYKKGDAEKLSVYECGFDPFGDSRQKFEVRFFLVAILFIIFDLEISFLFP